MKTNQPIWECIAQLGDVNPVDYGGYWVFRDTTGVYCEEAELLLSPDSDDHGEKYEVYRFSLDRCTCIDGILSDNKFHPEHPAWFAKNLLCVAKSYGMALDELVLMFCSEDATQRAAVYRMVGEYHGFENFDSYQLHLTRAEAEVRYQP